MALFVVGGVIKLNKLTWLLWQTCERWRVAAVEMREERKPRERYEGDFRGNKVEQEGKQEMNGVLIELSKKGVSFFFFCAAQLQKNTVGASCAV